MKTKLPLACAAALLASAFVQPASADLIGLWKFDGDATDRSGNGNDGELIDGEYSDDIPDVLSGQALLLDGGYVEVPHSDQLNITDAITISAFVKPAENQWEGIIAKNPSDGSGNNQAGNYELRIENGARFLHFLHQQGGTNDTVFHQGTATIVESDVWSHVAITADVESGDVRFYLNGELSETLEGVITVDAFPTNGNPLYIGSRADQVTAFHGSLDELSLWNEVLDADQIALLATGPAGGENAPDTDGDGIPDFFEERFAFLDPNNPADGAADQDGDGLSNAAEYAARTNLENRDTDGDGLEDGVETNTGVFASASDRGTDPRRPDTDGDGLPDGIESNSGTFSGPGNPGTSPVNPDTDGDTFGDFVEVTLGSNPLDAASQPEGVVLAQTGESWNVATAWTDGQVPSAGKNYLVVSSVAPVLSTPPGSDPVFGGDRLNLIGTGTELRLAHSGTARIAELGIDGGTLAKTRRGASRLGGAGDTLSVTQDSVVELRQPGTLSLGASLGGTSALTVRTSGNDAIQGNTTLLLEATNSGFSGGWQLENVTLKGAAADSLGGGDITLVNATLDLDYNLNHVDGTLDISGEESRIYLDQTLALGAVTINNGALAVPDGVYDYDGLGVVFDGGLQPIFVEGDGTLIIGGDGDGDDLPDSWEQVTFGNLAETGEGDTDGDGLPHRREFVFGTDPNQADTDGDGLGDLEEIETRGTNPRLADTDGDGLSDRVETNTGIYVSAEDTGTDPNNPDTDGDGLPDNVENNSGVFASAEDPGTDPNERDTDGDGASDGQEVNTGTDPHDGTDASALPQGTVGLWSFDSDGAVQPDLSGNGNDAEVMGATWAEDPERGGVMEFSNGGFLLAAHSDSLSITEAMTIAAWVKPVGELQWDGILAKNPSDGSGANHAGNYELRIENGGRHLHFLHQQGGNDDTAFQAATGAVVPPDVWTHVLVTADTETGDVAFYLNGELSETLEGVIAIDAFPTNENPLYIGSRADEFTGMDGFMDDVMLLNRAVDPSEVSGIMLGGFGGPVDPGGGGDPAGFLVRNVRIGAGGNIRIEVNSQPGQTYAAEFSTDLINWVVTVDDVASEGEVTVIRQPLPQQPAGFIRVRIK